MSVPFTWQQPPPAPLPPPTTAVQQTYTSHSAAHGSIGPVIGVMAVLVVLCLVAVMIGRLCSGSGIGGSGHGEYDMEKWVEINCSSCVDGRINVALPSSTNTPPAAASAAAAGVSVATSTSSSQSPKQTNEADRSDQNHN
ncbi:hypothetical protein Nepgr_025065 [Nepenthes gracilis]|uniref:Uncharacterized protein n=1 Tax=Nepenthes gracilis TaxID=150966 RepID=A0AAD3T728_NEPGR|nr:hypothetical protein Nepgr_025065 [Nepenthes gracilis]